ncbi:unnamed protein product [Oikopleura dioica]|uniref:Uncharacterized protein n=1 Tax=Oikopleura dioica TaxID=34765 RepID=E4X6C6_OIKDI|nr:unnamed protein product [Oikopleura dioica]
MLLMLGLASHYIGVDGMVAMLADIYPSVFKTSKKGRPILVAAISVTCFLIGIPMLTQGGIYVFQLFDKYGASGLAVLWFSYFSSTAIAWFHGMDNFYAKLDKMYKKEINVYAFPWTIFGFVLKNLTPVVCSLVFFGKLSDMGRTTYDNIYEYPAWADTIGVFMALTSMICVPLVLCYEFYRASGNTFKERWQLILQERLPEQTLEALAKIEEEKEAESKPALNSKTDFVD